MVHLKCECQCDVDTFAGLEASSGADRSMKRHIELGRHKEEERVKSRSDEWKVGERIGLAVDVEGLQFVRIRNDGQERIRVFSFWEELAYGL